MNEGSGWVNLSDYTHYKLAPEDLPYLTAEQVNDLVALFERSIKSLDPSAQFYRGWLPPSV
jgi:hypothetical protein